LLPFIFKGYADSLNKKMPLLSFSTLGCPEWSFEKILDFAVTNNYNGIELRGIQKQLDLTKCAAFESKEKIKRTKQIIDQKGLRIVDLGSSTELHHVEKATREKNIDEGKRFIELAAQINCPFIRVFPNNLPKTEERGKIIDLIIEGLTELGNFAKQSNVTVLLETHGDAVKTDELKKIMEATINNNTGLVWDIVNMWTVTKESPTLVFDQLKKYIRHTHLKDCKIVDGKINYVLFGTGEAPIFEAIDILYNSGYKGYYSFEWEKLWHPEIAEPEIALADFPIKMKKHFGSV
jgi:sugar phosphate isomerase/epimerase